MHAVISDPNPPFPKPIITSGPKPFEIKTGRAIAAMEHRAQTMLYTLLTAERYGVEVNTGLLYYTQTEEVVRVPASRNELRGLFIARNEMASYMMRRTQQHSGGQDDDMDVEDASAPKPFLPPTIDDERTCKRCYALDTCMLYRKVCLSVIEPSSSNDHYRQWKMLPTRIPQSQIPTSSRPRISPHLVVPSSRNGKV